MKVSALYAEGLRLSKSGDYAAARSTFRRVVAADPDYALASEAIGLGLHREGHAEEAVVHLERALALDPTLEDARMGLGLALAPARRYDEAREVLEGLAAKRDDPLKLSFLGDFLAGQGEFKRAEGCFREALLLDPHHVPSLRYFAKMESFLGHDEMAESLYLRAVERDPHDRNTAYRYGKFLSRIRGRRGEALKYLRLAAEKGELRSLKLIAKLEKRGRRRASPKR